MANDGSNCFCARSSAVNWEEKNRNLLIAHGSPGRNLNQGENTENLRDSVFGRIDTPKNTPSKRWLLPDVVG